ncbi:MAG: hypothetical protein J7M03_07025 [Candidatus Desulfofervidaceae bacterium]|nr:hypothetical protein [Candidatus Desulfofervidaceae bacterium]MDL1970580.1 hypothetical protein [Candidatus Desulfofervidaceae bacterium]
MEALLHRLAEQILNLDEASLTSLLEKYRAKIQQFEPTKEWEKAVIVFFMINGVKVKNLMFNEQMLRKSVVPKNPKEVSSKPHLKLIK